MPLSSSKHESDKLRTRKRNKNRLAIALSIAFHVCLLAVLVIIYIPRRESKSPSDSASKPGISESQADRLVAAQAKQAATSTAIQSSVKAHVEAAANKPPAETLAELDTKARQLDKYIDARTVEETAEAVAGSLGIERSTYQPKDGPVPGALDLDTAQILDIVPNAGGSKEEAYMATMIDAQGHQAQIPISESEGKTAYEAFQKMKNYPALEGLYRQIVMPLIQKMMSSTETPP
jgi:hypothetical protein